MVSIYNPLALAPNGRSCVERCGRKQCTQYVISMNTICPISTCTQYICCIIGHYVDRCVCACVHACVRIMCVYHVCVSSVRMSACVCVSWVCQCVTVMTTIDRIELH